MGDFLQFLIRLLVIGGLSLIFIMALIFLRPTRVHRRRKISTSVLKISYLVYLGVFLFFIYVISFTDKNLQDYFNENLPGLWEGNWYYQNMSGKLHI